MSYTPSSTPSTGPAPYTLPTSNAYFCCNCQYGPMLYELHPACVMCGAHACAYCQPTTIYSNAAHTPQQVQGLQVDPRDPYGASLGFGDSSDGSMMLRYLHDEPNVSERLSSDRARRSLTDMEEDCDNLLQQHGYKMRIAGEKLLYINVHFNR